jgi:hypothetical protein
MYSLETRLHSGEGTVGFELVGDLFVNLAFEDFRKAGQGGYRSITVWVYSVPPLKRGMINHVVLIKGK